MPRKRLLNITSKKKQDKMLCVTNTTVANPSGGTYARASAIMKGDTTYYFPWIPTARTINSSTGIEGGPSDAATRTASTCFMRGLKETGLFETNSGASWMWRRICFTYKGDQMFSAFRTPFYATDFYQTPTGGYARLVNSVISASALTAITGPLFQGTFDVDWSDPFDAKVNNHLVTLKYDKVRMIRSGNAAGVALRYSKWYPMNKNLRYGDDENGDENFPVNLSTGSKEGMGDYVVLDIIRAVGNNAVPSDTLYWRPEATLYWHER